jgi:hypothetical protein
MLRDPPVDYSSAGMMPFLSFPHVVECCKAALTLRLVFSIVVDTTKSL